MMRPIVLYHSSNARSRQLATAVATTIGADVALLGDGDTSDFWRSLGRAFDALARDLPGAPQDVRENFDLVVVGDSHLAARAGGSAPKAAVPVRVFLRFHDDDAEPLGLFVTYSEEAPARGSGPVAESVTIARGLTRIKYALGEAGEDSLPLPEAVQAVEATLKLRMVDRLA
jgi:hypothetical protein